MVGRCRGVHRGIGLLLGELVDQAELVAERVLHHGPIDEWSMALMGTGSRIEARRLLHAAAQSHDVFDGAVDPMSGSDVDVDCIRSVGGWLGDFDRCGVRSLEDDLVFPGVSGAEVSQPFVPAIFGPNDLEAGDGGPKLVGDLEVGHVDDDAAKSADCHNLPF